MCPPSGTLPVAHRRPRAPRLLSPIAAAQAAMLVSATVALSVAATAQGPVPEQQPQIVTVGRGEIQVVPDRATLLLAVETRHPTASQASQDNARLQRAVFDTLRTVGLTADQLSTSDFSVMPEHRWNQQKQQQELTGFVVRNMVRVQVRQVEQLGRILDAALAKGSNIVSSLELYVSNTDAARREALTRAVEQAKLDAEVMAKAAGGTVSGLLELATERYEPPRAFPARSAMIGKVADAAPETLIGSGSQFLSVRVTARWRFAADRH